LLEIEIKSFTSFDLFGENGESWALWELPDQDNVRIYFDIGVGESGNDAADIFTSVIFTGSAKAEYLKMSGELPYEGRVFHFDRFEGRNIWEHLNAVVASCARSRWEETARELNRYFLWEFEGM
jgi:hypothetical protein